MLVALVSTGSSQQTSGPAPTFPTGTFLTSSTKTTSLRGHCSSFTFSSSFGAGVERLRSVKQQEIG